MKSTFEISYTDLPSLFFELKVAIKMKFCLFTEEQRATINEKYEFLLEIEKQLITSIDIYENNYSKYKIYDRSTEKKKLFHYIQETREKLEFIQDALRDTYDLKETMDPANLATSTWYYKIFEIFLQFSYPFRIKHKWFFEIEKEELLNEIIDLTWQLNYACDQALETCEFLTERKGTFSLDELVEIGEELSWWFDAAIEFEDNIRKVRKGVSEMGLDPAELDEITTWEKIIENYNNWIINLSYDQNKLMSKLIEELRIKDLGE